jgi:hypothetical protein
MLITTPYKNGDIVSLKVTSGEEILAKLVEEKDDVIIVTKPFALVPGQGGGLGMMPWILSIEPGQNISINKNTIMLLHKTEEGIGKQYIEQTTGLTMITK